MFGWAFTKNIRFQSTVNAWLDLPNRVLKLLHITSWNSFPSIWVGTCILSFQISPTTSRCIFPMKGKSHLAFATPCYSGHNIPLKFCLCFVLEPTFVNLSNLSCIAQVHVFSFEFILRFTTCVAYLLCCLTTSWPPVTWLHPVLALPGQTMQS